MSADNKIKTNIQNLTLNLSFDALSKCHDPDISDNAKFFYTATQKRKLLAKFKVVEKETNSKLAPLSKTETGQLLDCTSIKKARIKPGHTQVEIFSEGEFLSFI